MAWSVTLDFQDGSGARDITAQVKKESFRRTLVWANGVRPASSQLRFEMINNTTIANLFLGASVKEIKVAVTKDGSGYFTGIVQNRFEIGIAVRMKPVSVMCVDNGELLRRRIDATFAWVGYQLCDTVDPGSSVVHEILSYADITDYTLTDLTEIVDYVVVDRDEGTTYWELLEKVLFEHGYVFYFDATGDFRIGALFPSTATSTHTFDESVLIGELRCSKQQRNYHGVEIEWAEKKTLTNQIVFADTTGGDSTKKAYIPVPAGEWYPPNVDDHDIFADYRVDGHELVYVTSAALTWVGEVDLTLSSFTSYYRRARIKIENTSSTATRYIKRMEVRGNAVVRDHANFTRFENVTPHATQQIEKIKAQYLITSAAATKLGSGMQRFYKYGHIQYQFISRDAVDPGAICTIEDPILGMSNLVRISQRTDDEWSGQILYTAYGIAAYSAETPSTFGTVAAPVVPVQENRDVVSLPFAETDAGIAVFDEYEQAPDSSELFDLRQPDCVSSFGRKPRSRNVAYMPASHITEILAEYAEPRVKWAGLGVIATIEAMTNVLTDPEDMSQSTWTKSTGCTAVADTEKKINGHRFTKVSRTDTTATRYVYQSYGTKYTTLFCSVIIKKGVVTSDKSYFKVFEDLATERQGFTITWSTKSVTQTTGSGSYLAEWLADDVLRISVIHTGSNANSILFYPSEDTGRASGDYCWITCAMMVNTGMLHIPYFPTSFDDGELTYNYDPPSSGTVECWVRPMFVYTTGIQRVVWRLGSGSSAFVDLLYDYSTDKWTARIYKDASNYKHAKSTNAITSDATLQTWWHLKVVYDIPNQEISLYENGVLQTGSSTLGTVTGTAMDDRLQIGNTDQANTIGSYYITDFLIQPDVEDTTTKHYELDWPYTDPLEVANTEQTIRISKYGLRLHNAHLSITDDFNRLIELGTKVGLRALDAGQNVIHDIPNAPLLSGYLFGGHVLFREVPDYIATVTVSTTDTSASGTGGSGVQNTSLAAYVGRNTNVKGLLALVSLRAQLASAKAATNTYLGAQVKESLVYNTTPGTYAIVASLSQRCPVSSVNYDVTNGQLVLFPVVYDGSTPYITWELYQAFSSMVTASGNYLAQATIYILGLLI